MNFALGPNAVLEAMARGDSPRPLADFARHLNEVTLAIHDAGDRDGARVIESAFAFEETAP